MQINKNIAKTRLPFEKENMKKKHELHHQHNFLRIRAFEAQPHVYNMKIPAQFNDSANTQERNKSSQKGQTKMGKNEMR